MVWTGLTVLKPQNQWPREDHKEILVPGYYKPINIPCYLFFMFAASRRLFAKIYIHVSQSLEHIFCVCKLIKNMYKLCMILHV